MNNRIESSVKRLDASSKKNLNNFGKRLLPVIHLKGWWFFVNFSLDFHTKRIICI